jgi:hypothetical protein
VGKTREATTTQQSSVDPATQRYLQQFRQRAGQLAGTAGLPNQFQTQAGNYANQLAQNLGFVQPGLGGIDQFFNPFEGQVIAGLQSDFDRQRQLAGNQAADVATRSNAFGGSRSAILNAELQRGVNQNEASTLANVRNQGFQNAANQLLGQQQLFGNLGFGGLQALAGLGGQLSQQQLQSLLAMQGGLMPGSTTSTQTQQMQSDPFGQLLGVAGTVAPFFIPGAGPAIGAANAAGKFGSAANK